MERKILVITFQSLTQNSAAGIGRLAYSLAERLHQRGRLQSLIVSSKGKFITAFPSSPVSFWSRYYLYAINKFGKYINLKPYVSRYIQELLYDRFCMQHIDASLHAIVVTTPYLYHTFRKANKLGVKIYFIPGNPEDNFIKELVQEENGKYNIVQNDAYTYKPRLRYYNNSIPLIDHFLIYSSLMEKTYRDAGHGAKIISTRGYLKPVFNNEVIETTGRNAPAPFKVSFLAYTVLLKGLQYLLEAWKALQDIPSMELHIGGLIDKNVQQIIDRDFVGLKNVHYHGHITDIPSFFADKSIYVLTSLIDGAPVSILEAMHCGLPVICTENCGTKDILEEGKSGWIIPIRDAESIKTCLLAAYNNRERTAEMGQYARSVMEHYTIDGFLDQLADIVTQEY